MNRLRLWLIKILKIPLSIQLIDTIPAKKEVYGFEDWKRISLLFNENPLLYSLWEQEKSSKIDELCRLPAEGKELRRIELVAEIRLLGKLLKYNEIALPEMNRILMDRLKEGGV